MAESIDHEANVANRSEDEDTMVEEGDAPVQQVQDGTEEESRTTETDTILPPTKPTIPDREGAVAKDTLASLVGDHPVVSGSMKEWVKAHGSWSQDPTTYTIDDIDDRLPYRQGWPLLPVLPVLTSRKNVPKALAPSSMHLGFFRELLKQRKITVHDLEVAYRYNAGTSIGKSALTLCVVSEENLNGKWSEAIRALRLHIQEYGFTLAVEFIDHRIFCGLYTLPILPTETNLGSTVRKKRHGIISILNESGQPWTSLEFFWRGCGRTRENCKPTVLIGSNLPQSKALWVEVKPMVEKKMGERWTVEICFREIVKY